MERTLTCETGGSGRSESVDRVFSLLADGRRRRVLRVLEDHDDDAMGFRELVAEVARREPDSDDEIAVELHHVHLPKAAKAGVIDYDRRTRDVRYRGHEIVDAVIESEPA